MTFQFNVREFILGGCTGTPTFQFYKRGFNLQGDGSTPSWQDIVLSGNGSLTLTNAKANGLNYVKLYGGTSQRNLPEGYTQVEYIKSNGTQYIDTGINQTTLVKPRIITKYKIYVSEDKDWFGGSNDGGGSIIWNIAQNTTRIAYIRWKTQSARGITFESGYSESDLVFLSDFHTLDVGGVEESGVVPIIVDNNLIGNMNPTTTLNWVNHNLLIFRSGRSGQNGTCSFSYFTIYSNGIKVWNGVACRRNSDNVLGMYDTVSGQFFTNAGTGDFIAGAEVVPSPDTPIDIVSNNGVLKFGALGKNLFNPTKVLFGYYRDRTTGIKQQSSSNFMSSDDGYIPCLPNTTYTFVGTNKTNGTYSKYNTIYFFDSAKNYLGASPYDISQPTTGTTPNNCYYLQVRSNPLDMASVSIQDAFAQFNWQLELGSTATAYEPYQEGIYTDGTVEQVTDSVGNTASAERLLAVDDFKDTQEVIAGAVTRNIGIKVMTGDETFQAGTNGWISENTITNNLKDIYTPMCTHFRGTDETPTANSNTVRVYYTSQNIPRVYFGVDKTIYTSAEVFKQFLADQYNAGNPVIIVYPLATATTEVVTAQPLTIQAGTNIIEITQASMDNLGLEVSYKGTI